ncbi:MAG TPA: ABC transporter permease [Candidatus Aminicenantes bacterium]|nr:ABC transporter permease [Candidatus Aminicenantes bacterium]
MIAIFTRLKDYRDLLLVFIWREFTIRYKQSFIGILWAVLQPLSMMLLFTFLFTFIMPVKVTRYPYVVFFYSGALPWSFFSSSLNYAIPSLTNHYNLVTKIYFPREILPISGIGVAFLDFLVASLVYVLLLLSFKIKITLMVLWFFPLLILLLIFTLSVALVLSALNVYYRDVKLATGFLLQLWFFATPVFYSIDRLSLKLKLLVFMNPLTFIVENMRRCVIESRALVLWQLLLVTLFILVFFFLSYKFFLNTEKKFADVI